MTSDIGYATLPVPADKSPDEYTYAERRSELYNLIEEAGHPRNLERSQEELGRRYGVSQRQISGDIQVIREYEAERVGSDARANTEFICSKAVRELLSDGEYEKAAKLQLSYFEWLQDIGTEEKAPDKTEISGEGGGALNIVINETVVETGWEDDQ